MLAPVVCGDRRVKEGDTLLPPDDEGVDEIWRKYEILDRPFPDGTGYIDFGGNVR